MASVSGPPTGSGVVADCVIGAGVDAGAGVWADAIAEPPAANAPIAATATTAFWIRLVIAAPFADVTCERQRPAARCADDVVGPSAGPRPPGRSSARGPG